MALLSDSLVLRGVSVRQDGLVVGLRLGSGKANQAAAMGNPTRHPAGCEPTEPQTVQKPDDVDYPIAGFLPGAGRSRRWSKQEGTRSTAVATRRGLASRRTSVAGSPFGGRLWEREEL